MSTNDELYSQEQTQHLRSPQAGPPGQPGPPDADGPEFMDDFEDSIDDQLPPTQWHVGLDFGLLILRIAVGGSMLLAGLYKFGLFNSGLNADKIAAGLEQQGFSQPKLLSWVLMLTEVGGGALLIIGLLTPLAAAGMLGITASATYLARDIGYFPDLVEATPGAVIPGYQFPLLIGAGAVTLLFTGPGRVAMDLPFHWRRKPLPYGILGLLIGGGAAAAVLTLLR